MRLFPVLIALFSGPLFGFAAAPPHVELLDTADRIGLSNANVRILFRKNDGALVEISPDAGHNLLRDMPHVPLWTVELRDKSGVIKAVTAEAAKSVSFSSAIENTDTSLDLKYTFDDGIVRARIRLGEHDQQVHWAIEAELNTADQNLWSITYPAIPVAALDDRPLDNDMVVPYRRGQLRSFGKAGQKGDVDLPYPGPAAKFQFMAAYGKESGGGLYYAVEDGNGYSKSFQIRNRPEVSGAILASQHFPANRGAECRSYRLPYAVVTGPFRGDWWDAARLYRAWWVQQIWASKGLLSERHDLPAWLITSPLAVRPSTTKPSRAVANNLESLRALSQAIGTRPFFGTWYGCFDTGRDAGSLDEGGNGHVLPAKPGLTEAILESRQLGIHLQAYVQSMIYDASLHDDAEAAAEEAVTRDAKGARVSYGTGASAHLLAMCRATEWWQTRMADMARHAVGDLGCGGIYLDSFGKGAPECFDPHHGHPIGGGNTVIAGQRRMAERVRAAVKPLDPEAILSGEDPIEAFRDLLDVNLYAVNVMNRYVPVYRTVWGDYSLGQGRVLAVDRPECIIPELAVLFLEGTIPGRVYCEAGPPRLLTDPALADQWAFFQRITNYTQQALVYLREGEYMRPLTFSGVPEIEFTESCEKQRVRMPSVLGSVTRSHRDGSVAFTAVNISGTAQKVTMRIDPSLRALPLSKTAMLSRMSETGELQEIARGEQPWEQTIELAPGGVELLILR